MGGSPQCGAPSPSPGAARRPGTGRVRGAPAGGPQAERGLWLCRRGGHGGPILAPGDVTAALCGARGRSPVQGPTRPFRLPPIGAEPPPPLQARGAGHPAGRRVQPYPGSGPGSSASPSRPPLQPRPGDRRAGRCRAVPDGARCRRSLRPRPRPPGPPRYLRRRPRADPHGTGGRGDQPGGGVAVTSP